MPGWDVDSGISVLKGATSRRDDGAGTFGYPRERSF
jgi:hypothetical protein